MRRSRKDGWALAKVPKPLDPKPLQPYVTGKNKTSKATCSSSNEKCGSNQKKNNPSPLNRKHVCGGSSRGLASIPEVASITGEELERANLAAGALEYPKEFQGFQGLDFEPLGFRIYGVV